MGKIILRRIPKRHHGITNIFVNRCLAAQQFCREILEVGGSNLHQLLRRKVFSQGREAFNIAEHDTDAAPRAAELCGITLSHQLGHKAARHISAKNAQC